MWKAPTALVLAVAGCGSPARPAAPQAADVRAEIQAAYDGYAHAYATNDLAGVMAALSPDVEWRLADGTVQHRAEIEPEMAAILARFPAGARVYFTIDEVSPVAADRVVADVVFHLDAGDHHDRDAWQDTWIKTAAGWQNQLGVEQPPLPPE